MKRSPALRRTPTVRAQPGQQTRTHLRAPMRYSVGCAKSSMLTDRQQFACVRICGCSHFCLIGLRTYLANASSSGYISVLWTPLETDTYQINADQQERKVQAVAAKTSFEPRTRHRDENGRMLRDYGRRLFSIRPTNVLNVSVLD